MLMHKILIGTIYFFLVRRHYSFGYLGTFMYVMTFENYYIYLIIFMNQYVYYNSLLHNSTKNLLTAKSAYVRHYSSLKELEF